eukprot:858949-Rhodomonas_salina.1
MYQPTHASTDVLSLQPRLTSWYYLAGTSTPKPVPTRWYSDTRAGTDARACGTDAAAVSAARDGAVGDGRRDVLQLQARRHPVRLHHPLPRRRHLHLVQPARSSVPPSPPRTARAVLTCVPHALFLPGTSTTTRSTGACTARYWNVYGAEVTLKGTAARRPGCTRGSSGTRWTCGSASSRVCPQPMRSTASSPSTSPCKRSSRRLSATRLPSSSASRSLCLELFLRPRLRVSVVLFPSPRCCVMRALRSFGLVYSTCYAASGTEMP